MSLESEIFADALELPESKREKFLNRACAGDTKLHARVTELLNRAKEAQGFMEKPPHTETVIGRNESQTDQVRQGRPSTS